MQSNVVAANTCAYLSHLAHCMIFLHPNLANSVGNVHRLVTSCGFLTSVASFIMFSEKWNLRQKIVSTSKILRKLYGNNLKRPLVHQVLIILLRTDPLCCHSLFFTLYLDPLHNKVFLMFTLLQVKERAWKLKWKAKWIFELEDAQCKHKALFFLNQY